MKDHFVKPLFSTLFYFLIAAGLGISLRLAFVIEMPDWFVYKNIQHTHSHVALLGWLFSSLYLGVVYFFNLDFQKFRKLFWALQISVLGMLISFPITGYATCSIFFSTLHILLSYLFIYRTWRSVKGTKNSQLSKSFLLAGLSFLFVSSLGTWSLAPLAASGMKGSAIYYGAIQFYLHFQFNGWLLFTALAILFAYFNHLEIKIDKRLGNIFFRLFVISTVLTFALAVTWSTPDSIIFFVNGIGILIQGAALITFILLIYRQGHLINTKVTPYLRLVLPIAFIALTLKIIIQSAVIIPYLATVSYSIRNFVIGFIHLLMLGCLSLFVFGIIRLITGKPNNRLGTWIFIVGVILTEILLFSQGLMQWFGLGFMPVYYEMIWIGSIVIFVGILHIFLSYFRILKS